MHRQLIAFLALFASSAYAVPSCPITVGGLTLNATSPRTSGISPLLVFFDATTTTDSLVNTSTSSTFQDVNYLWNFSDSSAISGQGNWAYGSKSGYTSKNLATGGLVAHPYIVTPGGGNKTYTPIVTATDGTNTATCSLSVTVFDPNGVNGFPGTATTCVGASALPVAGVGGCPTGAAVLNQASYSTALGGSAFGNGKRVLFKCADTFTSSSGVFLNAVKWLIGAFGGCENTLTNRPIFSTTGSTSIVFTASSSSAVGDGRIADIDFNGNNAGNIPVLQQGSSTSLVGYQITLYNLNSRNTDGLMQVGLMAQFGLIGSTMNGMVNNIGVYFNNAGFAVAQFPGSVFPNLNYQALIGNFMNGVGAHTGCNGIETFRISAAPYFYAANNESENANNCGPVFKVHQANPSSQVTWIGQYSQYINITDNYFHGLAGASIVETCPQNDNFDERLRFIVVERNLMVPNSGEGDTFLICAQFETVRNNVIFIPSGQASPNFFNYHVGTRSASFAYPTQNVQVYNNTCYILSITGGQSCVTLVSAPDMAGPANLTTVKNNLAFASSGLTAVTPQTGNTISNNTVTTSANPALKNYSGTFLNMSDFKPTANFSGATSVPNQTDAVGVSWPSTWDLGAVKH